MKRENKKQLADYILKHNGIEVNVDSLFDCHVKRIHEYKRQLLNVLHIITLYNRIKAEPRTSDIVPRTFIFSGKAAPSYVMAKLIIKLINSVGDDDQQRPGRGGPAQGGLPGQLRGDPGGEDHSRPRTSRSRYPPPAPRLRGPAT